MSEVPPGSDNHLLKRTCSLIESLVLCAAATYDTFHIRSSLVGFMLSFRGRVKLNMTNPVDVSIIDLQYYSTEVDPLAIRKGVRAIADTL